MLDAFEGNLTWLKFPLSLATALGSVGILFWVRGRDFETVFLRNTVIAVTLAKFAACLVLYALFPLEGLGSDAHNYYLPQALRALSGEVPHRDFNTSYGLLFPYLLAPGLLLWRSVGSIVFTMLLIETAMLAVYVARCRRSGFAGCWRVVFLYVLSPISWYWVGAVGTNGPTIALFAMLALTLAESRRDVASGLAAAFGVLFSKISMVLCWPAIVLSFPRGVAARSVPIALVAVGLVALSTTGVDVTERAVGVAFRATSGNLWFLLSMLTDLELNSSPVKQLSMLCLVLALAPLCLLFLVGRHRHGLAGFDSAAAFLAGLNLIFMMLSYKTYPWYFAGFLPFVLHALMADGDASLRRLLPLIYLGSITNLEVRFWMIVRRDDLPLLSWSGGTLFVLDVLMLAAILYWTVLCVRRSRH
jgi:hypothetical protein